MKIKCGTKKYICNNKRHILGPERSLSKVGTSPLHYLDAPHILVTRLSTTTTLAVLSTKIIIHETSQQQKTYVPHGIDGLYVGSSLEHYFCYKCYLQKINSTRDYVTFEWLPTTIPFPKVSHEIYLLQTTEYILAILQTKKLSPDSPMDTPSPTPTSK